MVSNDLNSDNYGILKLNNIVFIDIDGVVNHFNSPGTYKFLDESVETLNELYKLNPYDLVLSSSWKNAYPFTFLQKLFMDNGIIAPLIDKTTTYIGEGNINKISWDEMEAIEPDVRFTREFEIFNWLCIFRPNHYLILDDFEMKEFNLRKHQVLTYFWGNSEQEIALRKHHLEKCNAILKL